MTLKQLSNTVNKVNKLLKDLGVNKEYAIFIKDGSDWYFEEFKKEWLNEYHEDFQPFILNTEISDDVIEFDFTFFEGWKDLEETQHFDFTIKVEEK